MRTCQQGPRVFARGAIMMHGDQSLLTVGPGYHSGPPGAREEAGLFRGEHRLYDLSVLAVLSAQPVRRSGALLIQDESERACPLAIQLPDGSSLAC